MSVMFFKNSLKGLKIVQASSKHVVVDGQSVSIFINQPKTRALTAFPRNAFEDIANPVVAERIGNHGPQGGVADDELDEFLPKEEPEVFKREAAPPPVVKREANIEDDRFEVVDNPETIIPRSAVAK